MVLQPRTRGNGTERQNKGRNISWQNGSLQRKPRLDYGIQRYARTSRKGPRKGLPKASGLVLVRSPLLTSHKWREHVPSGRLVCRCHDVILWWYVCFVLLRFRLYAFVEAGPSFNRPSIYRRPDSHTCFLFLSGVFLSLFPSIFCTISAFSLYGEYVVPSFLPDGIFFTL